MEDHAGHIFADRFGGSPKLDNLVSQAKRVNLSKFKMLENEWEKELKKGKQVSVDININYTNSSSRPVSFDISYMIEGVLYRKHIKN